MNLSNKQIAILAEDIYEDLELWYPYYRLQEEGIKVKIVAPLAKEYHSKHGYPVQADLSADETRVEDFDGIVIPGGFAPDRLRRYPAILNLVRGVYEKGGLIASICHGAWVVISAGIIKGKQATCFFAIKDDLINAGANYMDQEVVVDDNLITSRTPQDLPVFLLTIITYLKGNRKN
ncbi:MAG: type 1 glutamine amidotransferase domain-containing protein [Candidatus Caldatribacteriota bacterium]